VKENDTLVSIAANFDIMPTMLKKGNRLTVDFVYPGQVSFGQSYFLHLGRPWCDLSCGLPAAGVTTAMCRAERQVYRVSCYVVPTRGLL